ncbi:hypothetical protein BU16DRAFT_53013 [Lophium mytilinum]|uniref:Uncharacterized protein n=1 Tax=Lophium mytilinum TaxID=390894 RepID=A0A6A6QPU4_9PEZI|nr:hypothetical protein BU16DRAFT_53013 [Lophium mytilinum]
MSSHSLKTYVSSQRAVSLTTPQSYKPWKLTPAQEDQISAQVDDPHASVDRKLDDFKKRRKEEGNAVPVEGKANMYDRNDWGQDDEYDEYKMKQLPYSPTFNRAPHLPEEEAFLKKPGWPRASPTHTALPAFRYPDDHDDPGATRHRLSQDIRVLPIISLMIYVIYFTLLEIFGMIRIWPWLISATMMFIGEQMLEKETQDCLEMYFRPCTGRAKDRMDLRMFSKHRPSYPFDKIRPVMNGCTKTSRGFLSSKLTVLENS